MILVSVDFTTAQIASALTDFGAGARLRLERSAIEAGVYTEFATVAIAAGVVVYDVWDPAGDADSWYRTLFSEDDGANPGDPGDPFQAGEQAYATRTDLLARFGQAVTDPRKVDRLTTVLAEATRDLIREVGYPFFRQPLTGTEDVTFDGTGRDLLHVHGTAPRVGVVSIGTLEVRHHVDDTWIEIPADEYRLEGNRGGTGVEPGDPYFHVRLLSHATYRTFPKGTDRVRLSDSVFGWPAIQPDHRKATVAWAHQTLFAEPGMTGIPAPDDMGPAYGVDRHPRAVYDLLCKERDRHASCWT